jgi:hypothetical protein
MMGNPTELSNLSTQQLIDLLWEVRGTPQAQPLYAELNRRPPRFTLEPDDPNWEAKMSEYLHSKLAQLGRN